MKRLTLLLFLTLSSVAFFSPQAKATPPSYSSGDLLLGFWATSGTGASEDYVVDLGQITNFDSLAAGGSMTLLSNPSSTIGNIGADLTSVFGTDWYTNPNLLWSAIAAPTSSDLSYTIYASSPESTPGTIGTPVGSPGSPTSQHGVVNDINGFTNTASGNDSVTANSKDAVIQEDSASNSWEGYQYPSGVSNSAFGYFPGQLGGNFDNTETSPSLDTPIDIFQYIDTANARPSGAVNYEDTLTIDNSGDITFTNENTAAVPEPVTYGMLLWGAGSLVLLGRLRKPRLQG